jgi:pimeloyl-ACP methyl ester carboxylesterase
MRPRARRSLSLVFAHPEKLPGPLLVEQAKGSGKPGFIDALDALSDYPLRDRLQRISVPTLIVWGDRDKLVPRRDADVFEELIPNARKIVYHDTGHVPMLERPARFNADLESFLSE